MPTANDYLLYLVAKLYYEQELTQQEIGEQLGLSRFKIQRLLTKAREQGVVRIELVPPTDQTCKDLESELQRTFGLQGAVVVPGEYRSEQVLRKILGLTAAELLPDLIAGRRKIGLGCGRTILEMLDHIDLGGRQAATVVPLFGGMENIEPEFQVNALAQRLAAALGGEYRAIYAPVIAGSAEARATITSDPMIKPVVDMWESLDLAIVGIGYSIATYGSAFIRAISEKDMDDIKNAAAAGDVCRQMFSITGEPCQLDLNARLIAMSLEQLKRVPMVVAIAGGKVKAKAILGALRGGYTKFLISDEATVRYVLELHGEGASRA